MNKKLQHMSLAAVLATSSAVLSSNASAYEATLSGNAGILSDYNYRGIPQDSGVGNGGVDLEIGGFYLGTWIADVGDGIEYDFYAGYVHEFASGFYLGAGYTTYQYSDDFDAEYNEVNTYAGWSNDAWSIAVGWNGAYLTHGRFEDDAEDDLGNYFELGYGFEIAGFDMSAALVHTDDADILGDDGEETEFIVSIHRSFDILSWGSGN